MVQPKYSPEEALQRVKLMMGYDTKKTLNENKSTIFEANTVVSKNPNELTDADLLGDTGKIRQYFQQISDFNSVLGLGLPNLFDIVGINFANDIAGRRNGVKGVVDALDGFVDSKDLTYVLTVIKSLDGKCYYDDVEDKTKPAIIRFLELYKEDEGGDELAADVDGVGTRTLPTGTDKIKQKIVKEIETQKSKSCNSTEKTNDEKKKTGGGGTSYKPCQTGKYVRGCKSDIVKKVQACLGMPEKYQTGNFGPITQGQLQSKFPALATSFTDKDVETICSGTEEKLGSDVESQTLGQDQNVSNTNTNVTSNTNQPDSTTKTGIS